MNKTQRVIILVGDNIVVRKALETIKGFKAITIVNELNPELIQNVFRYNKNVVTTKSIYNLELSKYDPIIINVINGKTEIEKLQLGIENVLQDFPKILESQKVDVGDYISSDSKDCKSTKEKCFICKVIQGCPEKPEHILYESENFIVIPGLGAFFDGYVMIVPKKHVMSFAELSDEHYEEFLQVLNDMKFILKSVYHKEVFVFECGSGKNGGGKHATSIVHAHVHLAPTDMPVLKEIQKSGLYPAIIDSRDLTKKYGEYPYMLYIDQEENWYIVSDPDTYFPRQHPRQVLAEYMNLQEGEYNWRTNPLREKMDTIAEEIYSFCKKEYENLPAWIQAAVKNHLK